MPNMRKNIHIKRKKTRKQSSKFNAKTQKTHKKQGSTKILRERVHVKNDASTYTHFYAHPYTRKRISHTRDCNVIALNASHTIHLHIISHILSAYFFR